MGSPEQMKAFLKRHFNCNLLSGEKEAILNDFPKLNCMAMEVSRLDDEVRKQLRHRGKDPQFGAEKTRSTTEMVVDKAQIALFVQRAPVLLGSSYIKLHLLGKEKDSMD